MALTERELLRLRRQKLVWRLAHDTSPPWVDGSAGGTQKKGALNGAVLAAIDALGERFTVREVEEWIRQQKPELAQRLKRSSLSSALIRIAGSKAITVEEAGEGRRPTTYRRAAGGGA